MTANPNEDLGYIESAQRLAIANSRQWGQQELLRVAKAAELRKTGWPIGLVLQTEGCAPVSTSDGIEARLGSYGRPQWEDFWVFLKDGSYYVIRLLEENFEKPSFTSSLGHPSRALWFDVRIWRIAEVLLHSVAIYRELGVAPNDPYVLAVNHGGLTHREFYRSSMGRHVMRGRFSQTPTAGWIKEVTQDYVTSNLKSLVTEIASDLFVLFDFASIGPAVIEEITDEFLRSKV